MVSITLDETRISVRLVIDDDGQGCFDMVDFLLGPVDTAEGIAANTGGAHSAEDVTCAVFKTASGIVGTGSRNFNAADTFDRATVVGSAGTLQILMFTDTDLVVVQGRDETHFPLRSPPHVHQPLMQTIVDELQGVGACPSTGESGARASWVKGRSVGEFYGRP